ncbi:MAG: hypothetical protein IT373_00665 [Polyangiaceae bacterium]|nr:hypothetical protein [Polyangiaceae bacterium]
MPGRARLPVTLLAAATAVAVPGLGSSGWAWADDPAPEVDTAPDHPKPPPLHVDYASWGVGIVVDGLLAAGPVCRSDEGQSPPCIVGSGGGLSLRGGYRSPGPWYVGGAYQFTKTDSSNLYRLGIMQQLRAEMRYMLDMGYRVAPYATWGLGGVVYGNEFGVETGGGALFGGIGAELQLTRLAMLGIVLCYQPTVFAGWTDTAGYRRDPGMSHYLRFELQFELRSELSRR